MAKSPLAAATHANDHHVLSPWVYVKTLLALFALMAATVAVSYFPLRGLGPISGNWINNLIALGIATLKAWLVIMFFMHVKYSTRLTKLWVLAGFTWLSLMSFILVDYGTRKYEKTNGWAEGESSLDGSALPRDMDHSGERKFDPNGINLRPRG